MTRREKERAVCQRVAAKVHEVTPPGLGRWDPALEIVREPSDAFLDALDVWLDQDSDATRRRLQERADALVRAWGEAARQFEAEGRPEAREEVPA